MDDVAGKRKVNILLHLLGSEGIKLYNTFELTGTHKNDLSKVLAKFDEHYGHTKFRSVRRQDFLARVQQENEPLMDFIADIKHKASLCEYGTTEESLVIDKIINGIKDRHIKTRLLDLDTEDQTLENVIKVCRSSELTQRQLDDNISQDVNYAGSGQKNHTQPMPQNRTRPTGNRNPQWIPPPIMGYSPRYNQPRFQLPMSQPGAPRFYSRQKQGPVMRSSFERHCFKCEK